MSPLTMRRRGKKSAVGSRSAVLAALADEHLKVTIIVAVTALAVMVSAATLATMAFVSGQPLLPDLYVAIVAPALLAPAVLILLLGLGRRLYRAERQLTAALLVNETRFETMARVSPVGIFQTDSAGLCLFVNERWCEITGLTAAQAAGEGWAAALHPDDRVHVTGEWYASARDGRPFRCEYRFLRPDGGIAWVLGQAEAKRGPNGEALGYFGTVTEITRNKESEKVLQRTNRALKVVSECNAALVRITDESELLGEICRIIVETGQYRMAWVGFAENDEQKTVRPVAKWGQETGYLDEVKVTWGDSWGRCGPAAHAIRYAEPYIVKNVATDPKFVPWRAVAQAHGYASLISLPLLDESRAIGILAIYAPDPDTFDDEEERLLSGLARNLTYGIAALRTRAERTRAEEEIREREERFRATFEQAAVGMCHVAPDGRYLRVNQKLCDITGYTRDELLNISFPMITHPADVGRDKESALRVLTGETPLSSIEKRYIRKDGSIIWVNRTVSLLRDSAGNPKYLIAVVQDITEAKQMETQLRHAQKMEAVGQLTGGVAHDFNNLLTVVLGNLELLKDKAANDPKLRGLADRAIAAADRAAALTQRLLAFSRKQVLQPQVTDVNRLISGMHDLLYRSLSETVRIETRLAKDLPAAIVDPGQLEIALLNLAVNARDAMPRGGSLTISTDQAKFGKPQIIDHDEMAAGDYLVLSVTDSGIGMPPEVRERAFEPFFTTKAVGKGSGLGLSMVYGFVKQTGGQVAIASELGKGTTIRLYLPCASDQPPTQVEAASQRPGGAARGGTILVVEDDKEVRALTVGLLREMGYAVTEAADAKAALQILGDGAPVDLLLTDVILPGTMTGFDLARETLQLRPATKILFMSGYSDGVAKHISSTELAAQLLQKPFRKYDLATQVQQILGR